jgi:hypothetical protein
VGEAVISLAVLDMALLQILIQKPEAVAHKNEVCKFYEHSNRVKAAFQILQSDVYKDVNLMMLQVRQLRK